nr:cytidylate kinase family protein [Thiomicrorhabdus sp.]
MSIIVICGVSQCYSEEVSKQVADSLSYVYVGNEIFDSTAKKYKISREDIDTVLSGNTSMFGISEKERRKYISYLKYELAEIIVKDNVVINNLTSYLLPKELNHILRACLVGDFEWRVKQLTTKGKSDKHARNILKSEDSVLFDWVNSLHGLKPWSRRLFDIIEPMQNNSIEKAVDIIVKNAQKPIFRVDEKAIKLMNDFALASKVVAHCATQRHEVDVQADAGKATIYLRTFTLRMKSYKEELK